MFLLLFEERRRGKSRETTGLIVGSDAQMIPVSTSIIDQIAASVLSPRLFQLRFVMEFGTMTYR